MFGMPPQHATNSAHSNHVYVRHAACEVKFRANIMSEPSGFVGVGQYCVPESIETW